MSGDTAILALLGFAVLYLMLGSVYAVVMFVAAMLLGAFALAAGFVFWICSGLRNVKRWRGREMFALAVLAFLQLTRPDGQKIWLAVPSVESVTEPFPWQHDEGCAAYVRATANSYCVKEAPAKVMEMILGFTP